ncbi:LCP family protein [Actinorugispora endophytica]|uniref:LytR family transcriptional attenuator n=1 Tax=Actinorugispora endophytica TaxID=1605990 RepID=A0A4R6UWV8_9ACTN|nr:LCP family protein [Actinorugispora endophytica]TDQ51908.1 LytR family transcriptional attenuator [Actinorugispora endophytica]
MSGDGDEAVRGPGDTPEFRRVRSGPTPPESGTGSGPRRRTGSGRAPAWLPSAAARRRRLTLTLAGALSIAVLLASGTAWAITGWASGQLNRYDVFAGLLEENRPEAGPQGTLNFLVIGSDRREGMGSEEQDALGVGDTDGQRSDTMMLVHLNNERDQVTVVGIPRDSWVRIPGYGEDKINAAYAYGGPQLAIQTVESATGVRVDHYVEVDFGGFVDVVDALEGITVCLPEAIHDDKARLHMEAGTHQVDGVEALAFARTRKSSDGDLDRIDRQQQVLSALLDKALSSETLTDPARFGLFLDTALGSVTVDEGLDTASINQLGNQMRSVRLDDVTFTQVPIGQMDFWTPHGDVAVKWQEEAARELFGRIARDEPLTGGPGDAADQGAEAAPVVAPGDIEVEVYNGIGAPGLGAQVRADLAAAGFLTTAEARDWTSRDVPETLVRYAPGREDAARLVQDSLPGAGLQRDAALGDRIQVVIGFNHTRVTAPGTTASPASDTEGEGGRDTLNTSTAADNVCG